MTDTAPPEQILTEAADRALELAEVLTRSARAEHTTAGAHMSYLAGLIRGGITNLAIAYDRGWDEGYDAAPTPLAAPADMAAVWQGLNTEQRAVVCIVSPELAGMLDAAEDPAPVEVTESEMVPPPYYVLRLREALGAPSADTPDAELVDQAIGVITRARRAAHAWAGTGEPGEVAAAALQDLVHYLDERAA